MPALDKWRPCSDEAGPSIPSSPLPFPLLPPFLILPFPLQSPLPFLEVVPSLRLEESGEALKLP